MERNAKEAVNIKSVTKTQEEICTTSEALRMMNVRKATFKDFAATNN
jgi:hypothetical protein